MCVMCSTSVPTLFQYFFYDHIPTFLYIFHEMFFITCYYSHAIAQDINIVYVRVFLLFIYEQLCTSFALHSRHIALLSR